MKHAITMVRTKRRYTWGYYNYDKLLNEENISYATCVKSSMI